MKNKTLGIVIMQFFFLLLASCNDNIENESFPVIKTIVKLTPEEYASIAFDNPQELDEQAALSIAENFVGNIIFKTKSNNINTSFKVKSKTYIKINDSEIKTKSSLESLNIPIYEVTITDGENDGLVLVSGDERAQKAIAYIPDADEENYKININAQRLRGAAISKLVSDVKEVDSLKNVLRSQTLKKIGQKLGIAENAVVFDEIKYNIYVGEKPLTKSTAIQTPPSILRFSVSPRCTTQWYQDEPYNYKMTYGWVDNNGVVSQKYYWAGCGPICVAQIFATIRPSLVCNGININWSYLKQNAKITISDPTDKTEMVSNLVKFCFDGCHSYYKFNKENQNTSTATNPYKLVDFVRIYANTGLYQAWNAQLVYNSIVALKPVIVMGAGHAFILDGYLQCDKYYGYGTANVSNTDLSLVNDYDCYFHTNLGWGGRNDGYYLIEKNSSVNFETPSHTFPSYDLYILPDISRK